MSSSPVETERLAAAYEITLMVACLVEQNVVPDYMHEFVMSRVKRMERAYGWDPITPRKAP